MTFAPFDLQHCKYVVPYWIIVHTEKRGSELFHPIEREAAEEYYKQCTEAGLHPTIKEEYTQ